MREYALIGVSIDVESWNRVCFQSWITIDLIIIEQIVHRVVTYQRKSWFQGCDIVKKRRTVLFAFPGVLVLALAFQLVNSQPANPMLDPSAITWADVRHDNATVTGTVEDDTAIIDYGDGRVERIELVEDDQSYPQSNFP